MTPSLPSSSHLIITTDISHVMHAIRTTAFSSFRVEEKITGLVVFLLDSLQEHRYDILQPMDARTSAKLSIALRDYKKSSSHNRTFLPLA